MAAPQAAGRFKRVGEEHITRLRGMTLFGIIKQMQHLCGVASMMLHLFIIVLYMYTYIMTTREYYMDIPKMNVKLIFTCMKVLHKQSLHEECSFKCKRSKFVMGHINLRSILPNHDLLFY